MFFGPLLMGVERLVLVSPFPSLPSSPIFPELFQWWSALAPCSPMLPYLPGRGPIIPTFARLWAGRLQSRDQRGRHEWLFNTALPQIGQPLRNQYQQGRHAWRRSIVSPQHTSVLERSRWWAAGAKRVERGQHVTSILRERSFVWPDLQKPDVISGVEICYKLGRREFQRES
jgi:hypothetical protein